MRLKNVLGDTVIIAVIGVAAFGLYRHLQSSPDSAQDAAPSARYVEPHDGIGDGEAGKLTTEDCERFLDTTMAQSCREARSRRITAGN